MAIKKAGIEFPPPMNILIALFTTYSITICFIIETRPVFSFNKYKPAAISDVLMLNLFNPLLLKT